MTAALKILKRARSLIETPEKWNTGRYAENADGRRVLVQDKSACRFCTVGALMRASYEHCGDVSVFGNGSTSAAYHALRGAMAGWVIGFNDSHTHAEVLAAFDKAIANLEAAQ